jgi:1-deoxy-D-xylulose-5-phosphate reductoisomerase
LLPLKHSLYETVIVSANDTLVEMFLKNEIKFIDIEKKLFEIIKKKEFTKYKLRSPKSIKDIMNLNKYVRLKIIENSI